MPFVLLPINTSGSDGDGRKWPKHHYVRNDDYFLERIATDKWIKDLPGGAQPGTVYRLDRLPQGYAGFERARPSSKHIDRYIYGHPRGQFRSLNEFYPHFKHMMDNGTVVGCPCKNCAGPPARPTGQAQAKAQAKAQAPSTRVASYDPPQPAQSQQEQPRQQPIPPFKPEFGQQTNGISPPKRKFADVEGTSDIYESLITQLKDAGPDSVIDLPIEEHKSPDWWTGYATAIAALKSWQDLPRYAPRCGEVVLFPRGFDDEDMLKWDPTDQTFRRVGRESRGWSEQPEWMAGVVTQIPDESISDEDMVDDSHKSQAVNYSGFRIEPLPDCGEVNKSWAKQSKYVPLHLIRPLSMLSECMNGLAEKEWHSTIRHARKISSSFSVVGRHKFKGTWPHATVLALGAYIGAELVLPGDVIRLLPRPREQKLDTVTDIMVVSAIRLRLVNLDLDEEDDYLPNIPYQVCLHFSGRVYTQDPQRSYDGVGKRPINPESNILPSGLEGYGTWYHYSDPDKPDIKTELPFTRVLSRCVEDIAMTAWFTPPKEVAPTSSFHAVNAAPPSSSSSTTKYQRPDLSRGLAAVISAREFSSANDPRVRAKWFWADTRIEQLDLHEVNDRFVGVKHALRTNANVAEWRSALKGLAARMVTPATATATAAAPGVQTVEGSMGEVVGAGLVPAREVLGESATGDTSSESLLQSEQGMIDDEEMVDESPLQSVPQAVARSTMADTIATPLVTYSVPSSQMEVNPGPLDRKPPQSTIATAMAIEDDNSGQQQQQQQRQHVQLQNTTRPPASPPPVTQTFKTENRISTPATPRNTQSIDLASSDSDDDDEERRANELADELAKQFRSAASSRPQSKG